MLRLLLISFLLAPAALAQGGLVSSAETDKAEYAYGETIELRYTITNTSDETITVTSMSGSCAAGFTYGSFVSLDWVEACTTDERPWEFGPGGSWIWTWHIIPNEHGVPETSGEQTVTAHFEGYGNTFPATATFEAPQYLGGRISLSLAEGYTMEDVQDVADALNAVVITAGSTSALWEISGVTIQEAVATYGGDPRFERFEIWRLIDYAVRYAVDAEGVSAVAEAALTAAHPNPFAAATSFTLSVPEAGPVRVEVFDVLGRRVALLHDGPLAAGAEHGFTFRASALPAGAYVVRAAGEGFTLSRRLTLAR